MPPRGTLFAALLLIPAALCAQRPTTHPAITPADLSTRLYLIADDSMQGRESGSLGDWKTAEYVASEFQRLGLEPAGENGSWFQTVPFVVFRPDSLTRIVAGSTVLHHGSDLLLVGPPIPPLHLPAVVPVYGGAVNDSSSWIAADSAKGRAVIFDVAPGPDAAHALRALGPVLRNPRFTGAALVVVAGLDLVGPESRAAILAGRVTSDTTVTPGRMPVILSSRDGANALFGRPLGTIAPGTVGAPMEVTARVLREPVAYPARNVVGIIRGSDRRLNHEYVALTAHNDHVGFDHEPVDHDSLRAFDRVVRPMGADSPNRDATPAEAARIRLILDSLRALRPPRLDSIRNGADDDGSGTASILELAERMAGERRQLRRSILFVSHTGEENGLLGSNWFTDHPTVPVDSIVAEIDQDMVGRGTAQDVPDGGPGYLEVIGSHRVSTEFGDLLEAANRAQPHPFVFNYAFDAPGHPLQYYCRADHYNYARYSIPAVSLSRGEHLDYHQVTDEAQYIDYEDMTRVALLVHDAAMIVANRDQRPALSAPKHDPHVPCRQ